MAIRTAMFICFLCMNDATYSVDTLHATCPGDATSTARDATISSEHDKAMSNNVIMSTTTTRPTTSRRSILRKTSQSLVLPFLLSQPFSPSPANAAKSSRFLSSDDLRQIYDDGADTYEALYSDSMVSRTLDFPALRTNLLSNAYGNVLELGVGTGLNLPYYYSSSKSNNNNKNNAIITSYTAIDISPKMIEQAKIKFEKGKPNVAPSLDDLYKQNKVDLRIGDVSNIVSLFGNDHHKFDTIIDTFGLCVFPDPITALKQARELLTEDGKILLLEHQDSVLGKVLNPTRNIADVISTCRYDDDVLTLLTLAGYKNIISTKSYAGGFLLEIVAS